MASDPPPPPPFQWTTCRISWKYQTFPNHTWHSLVYPFQVRRSGSVCTIAPIARLIFFLLWYHWRCPTALFTNRVGMLRSGLSLVTSVPWTVSEATTFMCGYSDNTRCFATRFSLLQRNSEHSRDKCVKITSHMPMQYVLQVRLRVKSVEKQVIFSCKAYL
jgi:hypothetical protein